jgi:DMSO reductase anchor subunit
MHPAFSVIFFTTATGAGYGLLALLGVSVALGAIARIAASALSPSGLRSL